MNAHERDHETIAPGNVELENTLASVLFALMLAMVLLLVSTVNPDRHIVERDGDVIETEVIRRSTVSGDEGTGARETA